MEIKLNVYENDMKTIKKECVANTVDIPFGLVRKLMKLFDVENLDDTTKILNIVMKSWDDVISLLDRIFPDMEEEDWDYVGTKELVQVIFQVLKEAAKALFNIPTDPKN